MSLIKAGLVPGAETGTLVVRSASPVNATLAANIPASPKDGQTHLISVTGNFESSALIDPVGETFEKDDYMRFDGSLQKWKLILGSDDIIDEAFGGSWNGDVLDAPSRNSLFDKITAMDTSIAGNTTDINKKTTKNSVSLLATADIALTGVVSVDGVNSATGQRIGAFLQSTVIDRGIYVANDAGAWTRATDFIVALDVGGASFFVQKGAANGDKCFAVDQDDPTAIVGTSTLTVTAKSGVDANALQISQNLGDLNNTGTARTNMDVLSTSEVNFLIENQSAKNSVSLLATANIALTGLIAVDGIAVTDGQRVGAFLQTTVIDRGIYIAASGAWARAADFATGLSVGGATFFVQKGTANADKPFSIDQDDPNAVVGTDTLTASVFAGGGGGGALLIAQNLGDLNNIGTARTNMDVLSTAEVNFLLNSQSAKDAVSLLADANIALTGLIAVDGVLAADGQRIAAFLQDTTANRGVYIAAAGAWTRAPDFATGLDVGGADFFVQDGVVNGDKAFAIDQDDPDAEVGVDTLTVSETTGGAGSLSEEDADLRIGIRTDLYNFDVSSLSFGATDELTDGEGGTRFDQGMDNANLCFNANDGIGANNSSFPTDFVGRRTTGIKSAGKARCAFSTNAGVTHVFKIQGLTVATDSPIEANWTDLTPISVDDAAFTVVSDTVSFVTGAGGAFVVNVIIGDPTLFHGFRYFVISNTSTDGSVNIKNFGVFELLGGTPDADRNNVDSINRGVALRFATDTTTLAGGNIDMAYGDLIVLDVDDATATNLTLPAADEFGCVRVKTIGASGGVVKIIRNATPGTDAIFDLNTDVGGSGGIVVTNGEMILLYSDKNGNWYNIS